MFGWFQHSGLSNRFFADTLPEDIVLRSAFPTNKLVFGNENGNLSNAGMYIYENRIGVNMIPEYELDCAGKTRTQELQIADSFSLDKLQLHLKDDSSLFFNGVLDNKVVFTDLIKQKRHIIPAIEIVDLLQLGPGLYQIQLVLPNLTNNTVKLPFYEKDDLLQIETGIYQIKKIISPFLLNVEFVIDKIFQLEQGLVQNVPLDITVYKNHYNHEDIYARQSCLFTVEEIEQIKTYRIKLKIRILSAKYQKVLQNMKFYKFLDFYQVFRMTNVKNLGNFLFEIYLSTCDKRLVDPDIIIFLNGLVDPIELTKLNVCVPIIEERKYFIGTLVDNSRVFITVNNFEIRDMLEDEIDTSFMILDYISFNGNKYIIEELNRFSDTYMLLSSPEFTSMYSYAANTYFEYFLNCIPFKVLNVVTTEDGYKYYLDDIFNQIENMQNFKDLYIFNTGVSATLINVDIYEKSITMNQQVIVETFLYILPFEVEKILILTNENCFIEKNLGIGTQFPEEKLSVDGNAIVRNSLIYKTRFDSNQFVTKFLDSKFFIGNSIVVLPNNDVTLNGTITAKSYLNFSDSRLKKNISGSDDLKDLDMIKKMNVYDYQFLNSDVYHKGVLADEIELLCPKYISSKYDVLPIINRLCDIINGDTIVIEGLEEKYLKEFKVNGKLRISDGYDINICGIEILNNTLFIQSHQIPIKKTFIYIIGPYVNIRSIDTDSIMWMLLNSLKSVVKELEQLKSDMK